MDTKGQLKNFKIELESKLKEYFDKQTIAAGDISPFCSELMNHIAEITLRGGKRIRAAILYYSFIAHGGLDRDKAMKAALSMELMQTFLLIHDDIIDNDSLRRGGPTMHKIYQKIGSSRFPTSKPKFFGTSVAIMAGDIACSLSNELISESGFDQALIARSLNELNKMYIKEFFGEFLDILSELRPDVKKEDVILTHQLKTVPYTFDAPMKIGAILAGADESAYLKLEEYSTALGTAFQIQDDYLGMFGTVEKTGKPITSDLKEGKRTLLILDALEKASVEQSRVINDTLGNHKVSVADLKRVRKVIVDTGSLAESDKIAEKYVKEAISSIQSMNLVPEGKEFLLGIADWMINREY